MHGSSWLLDKSLYKSRGTKSYRRRYMVIGSLVACVYLGLLFLLHYLISRGTPGNLFRDSPAAVITVLLLLPLCLLVAFLLGLERDRREAARFQAVREQERMEIAENLNRLLRQAEEAKRMAAVAVQEIKHPLTSIVGYAMTLQEYWDKLEENARRDFLNFIRVSVSRLEGMLNDLTHILDIAGSRPRKEKTAVSLPEVLEEVSTLLQEIHLERGVKIATRVLDELPPLDADPSCAFDILYNLLDLCMRCSQDGKMVTAWCSYRAPHVNVHIRCPNPTIPVEILRGIERWPPSQEEGEIPTLAMEYRLTQNLTREMGGTLRMDMPGKAGLTFFLSLPASPTSRRPTR